MQSTKKLTEVFKLLLQAVEEEASKNPSFADRLEAIASGLPVAAPRRGASRKYSAPKEPPPDVFAVREAKGEAEFLYWLRSFDLGTLKAIVKVNGFDPGKASPRWTEPDKFAELISEQVSARL